MNCNCPPQNSNEIISIVISIFALLLSAIAIVVNKHINRSTLQAEFYSDHFKDVLNNSIPSARGKLKFSDERLEGYEELQDVLSNLRRNANYFRYAEPRFYKRLKETDQEIEDYIAEGINKKYDDIRAEQYFKECDKKLTKLYKIITHNYFG